jgi:ribose 5-phosphate isomerase B
MKEYLKQNCTIPGYVFTWIDVGADSDTRSDYPIFAIRVVKYIQEKNADHGILLCGTGIGMAIAANRFEGIYAGLAWNEEIASRAKEDDNVNVLVLPSDYIDNKKSRAMIIAWLGAEFKCVRYAERIAMIDAITQ